MLVYQRRVVSPEGRYIAKYGSEWTDAGVHGRGGEGKDEVVVDEDSVMGECCGCRSGGIPAQAARQSRPPHPVELPGLSDDVSCFHLFRKFVSTTCSEVFVFFFFFGSILTGSIESCHNFNWARSRVRTPHLFRNHGISTFYEVRSIFIPSWTQIVGLTDAEPA